MYDSHAIDDKQAIVFSSSTLTVEYSSIHVFPFLLTTFCCYVLTVVTQSPRHFSSVGDVWELLHHLLKSTKGWAIWFEIFDTHLHFGGRNVKRKPTPDFD